MPTSPTARTLVGIDPGRKTGAAVLEVHAGVVSVCAVRTFDLDTFHAEFRPWLGRMIDPDHYAWRDEDILAGVWTDAPAESDLAPDAIALERPAWFGGSPGRVTGLTKASYAAGIIEGVLRCVEDFSDYCHVVTPMEWRKAIGAKGNDPKKVVWQRLAGLVEGFDAATNEHQRDAVGIALACREEVVTW